MKQPLLALAATALVALGASSAQAAKVSVDLFYDALDPYGDWIDAADYGYVWHPREVDRDWRPYTDGNWAYTDAGWTWVSEEPYGWATYHYGRWVELERTGWVWVPDTTWGPAWVSWRRSNTHVGWAPLPPEARFEARTGFHGWVDSYYDIGPTYYSFVRVRDFGAPRLRTVIVEPRENITIISQTTNITNITYANNVVVNNGPEYDVIVRESAQPVRRLKLERRTDIQADAFRTAQLKTEVSGQSLRVVAPEIEAKPAAAAPKKVASKIERLEVNRGWRDAGNPQQVQQLRAKVASEAKAPAGLPPKPQLRGSESATAAPESKAGTAANEREMKKPPTEAPESTAQQPGAGRPGATVQQPGAKRPGTAAQQPDTDRPDATAQQPETARPGAISQQPGAKRPGATTQQPDASRPDATAQKPEADRPDTSAQQPDTKRPGATAQDKRGQQRDERPGVAKKKPGEEQLPAAEGPAGNRGGERPEAKRPMKDRPGAREEDRPEAAKPPAERAQPEGKPSQPDVEPKARGGQDKPERARPETDRPEPARPEAIRPENPREADRPERRGPAERPDRSPERARPEAAERSPENRPPAARENTPTKGKKAPAPEGEAKEKKAE